MDKLIHAPIHPLLSDCHEDFSDIVHTVFWIDHIRETILDYAIHKGKDVVISNVRSFRLVNKAWLQSTHTVLLRSQQPLFWFYLDKEEFRVGRDYSVKNEKLCEILRLPEGNDYRTRHVAPHSIHVSWEFMRQQNYQSFFEYLLTCGTSLVDLEVNFEVGHCDAMPLSRNFLLPKLQTFNVSLWSSQNVELIPQNMIDFIQLVLESSGQLKSFMLTCYAGHTAPNSFGNILLPNSLTELELNCPFIDNILEMLVHSSLSNMRTLKLRVIESPINAGLISRVLQNVRKTLEICQITLTPLCDLNIQPNIFILPLMEKLENLKIDAEYLQLEKRLSSLQQLVPVLSHITLLKQTNEMFRKWTEQSWFPSVEALTVSFVKENRFQEIFPFQFYANIELRTAEALRYAFPNLQELDITVLGTEMLALVTVAWEMRNLRRLRICLEEKVDNSNVWDAHLTGISIESVSELKESPALLKELQAANRSSIRKLTELHTLELAIANDFLEECQIISDVAFHLAFCKMPKLTKLILRGCSCVVSEIVEKWGEEGRKTVVFEHYYNYDYEESDVMSDDLI